MVIHLTNVCANVWIITIIIVKFLNSKKLRAGFEVKTMTKNEALLGKGSMSKYVRYCYFYIIEKQGY